ncbi:ATP-binding protein [Actinoplanes sp. LDG1-06]|uniref:ATP-binding protein n=1 Tax=Paractinoplanes ovalisporus TaxID=2810368 RepID=A0ABS2AMN5_9ACTN|nr:ATP-binding protein [Actinoplanes ovalisporus]MBM2621118.1 ATP-binding protein [Actinoplanes ovalisporus]
MREDQAWPTVEGISTEVLLDETFDRDAITTLRHSVASCARAAGLTGDRLDDFVVAVNELLTNAVRHGGGLGRVQMWSAAGDVVCQVSDSGSGLAGARLEPAVRPPADQPGGWGLWLAEELTDSFELITGTDGTTVRVSSRSSLSQP